MLVFEAKLRGTDEQYVILDEMIRTARFVRNSCLRYWMDNKRVNRYDLNKYCKILREQFEWCKKLSAQACQASAERTWSAIARFFDNCKKKVPGKKGFPKFKKHQTHGSVEYKVDGWVLSDDRLTITFRDGFKAGTFRMWGTRDLHFYQKKQIKRVSVVRRADGYYVQFSIDQERNEQHKPTNRMVGIDVGLNYFYTDSDGNKVENPRFLRKAEKSLKRAQKRVSRRTKGSRNRLKAIKKLGRTHLLVSRRRKDFAVKTAWALILSADLVAIEDLKVRNMVKNHHLAKSISDASWTLFRQWLEYFGKVFNVPVIAVAPHYTSQNCSNCGQEVKKSLSTRTHKCPHCGYLDDRDTNAAINILMKALQGLAQLPRGTRKVTPGDEMIHCLEGEIPKSKVARRARKPRQ
ncbi:RNA-guided endonuclease InsQ/TnpB family protein [Limnoraphis robusta]|uniref:Transposase n=1 Tax=Limnoraphis robusta CS-951 TaxID=1637645 RepID=A0A0J9HLQ5_9CYAN|nr:RNA-guided endonuclease TnpB family protein [Limnoraphis robusta]KMW70119.1 transposase [Limnoraphis robusta CS-951]